MSEQSAWKRHDEGGFTLIEMIITIVIATMLMGALAAVFVTSANSTNSTRYRSNQGNDAQVIASFLVKDAQAAGGVDPNTGLNDPSYGVFTNAPVAACTGAGGAITTTVVRFRWLDPSGPTYDDAVYWLSGNVLKRTFCTTPTAGGSTTTSDIQLAKTIRSASATCTTGASTGACDDGINGQSQLPDSVHLLVTATQNPNTSGPAIVGTYSYTLSANLRPARLAVSDIPSTDNSAVAALLTLGSGASCPPATPGVNMSNNTTLKVYGDVLVNQGSSCVSLGQHAEFDYHSLKTASGVTNPFATLQAPSTTGLPARSGCPGGVAQPGVYASALVLNNGSSCTFQSGIYILQSGLTLDNNSSMTTAAGGALFYLSGGAFSVDNNASVNIQALSSGPYAGLALWQVSSTTINVNNNGTFTIAGTLYVPAAALHFNNNAVTPQITAVIVASLDMNNNSEASFGPAPKALAVGASIPPAWTLNAPFGPIQATSGGGAGTYNFGLSGVNGITINSSTGVISGAPTQTGNHTLTLTLDDSFHDPQALATYPITINPAMTITNTSPLPAGNRNVAYSQTLTRTGGTGPTYTWAVTAGALPDGLTLNVNTGVISGTPTLVKAYNFSITVTDSVGATASKAFSLTIGTPPTITTLNPTSYPQGATAQNVVINGTNFQNGATVAFSGAGITINGPVTFNNATKLTVNITIDPAAATGARDVTVTNPDTGTVTDTGGFAVGSTLASLNPTSMKKGTSGTVTITGTGFLNGATLGVAVLGSRVTTSNVTYVNATTITATFTLAGNAQTTARTVSVTNGDGTPAGNTLTFTVTP